MRFLTSGRGEREHSMRGTHARTHVPSLCFALLYNADTLYGWRRQGWAELLEFCLGNNRTTDKGRSVVLLGWNYGTALHIVNNTRESIMTTWSWCDCDKCLSGT